MYQVVVFPPAAALGSVEEFRRLHDPSFHRLDAHLSLLPPFDPGDGGLVERFDVFRGVRPFPVKLGEPAGVDRALTLPVVSGAKAAARLQEALAAALLGPYDEPPALEPSLRIGYFSTDAEMELARRAYTGFDDPPGFTVDEVVLLLEDVRGLWHEVRRRPLSS